MEVEINNENRTLLESDVKIKPILISNKKNLSKFIPFLKKQKVLAIDLESSMIFNHSQKVSLIQIGTNQKQLLIDVERFTPSDLKPVMESRLITKVFFHGISDIMMLKNTLNCSINNIFDVSDAHVFLNNSPARIGLDKIIIEVFGVSVSKKYQRADWSIRPLSKSKIIYAATDIAYLIPLMMKYKGELSERGILEDVKRYFESLELITPSSVFVESIVGFMKFINNIKGKKNQLLAKVLHSLRLEKAKNIGRPFHYIINGPQLSQIIENKPTTLEGMKSIFNRNQLNDRELINKIIEIVKNHSQINEDYNIKFEIEIRPYQRAFNIIGKRNFNLIGTNEIFNILIGNDENISALLRKKRKLEKWRTKKANFLGKHPDLFLSHQVIKYLVKNSDFNEEGLQNVPGLRGNFWSEYRGELKFILSMDI